MKENGTLELYIEKRYPIKICIPHFRIWSYINKFMKLHSVRNSATVDLSDIDGYYSNGPAQIQWSIIESNELSKVQKPFISLLRKSKREKSRNIYIWKTFLLKLHGMSEK